MKVNKNKYKVILFLSIIFQIVIFLIFSKNNKNNKKNQKNNKNSLIQLEVNIIYPTPLKQNESIILAGEDCSLSLKKPQILEIIDKNLFSTTIFCENDETSVRFTLAKADLSSASTKVGKKPIKVNLIKPHHNNNNNNNNNNISLQKVSIEPNFNNQQNGKIIKYSNVTIKELHSTKRDIYVYTSPGYNENTVKKIKNVVIFNDAQELPKYSFVIDTLMKTGKIIDDILFVGINQVYLSNERYWEFDYDICNSTTCPTWCTKEYSGLGGGLKNYMDFIDNNLMKMIKKNFRVADDYKMGVFGTSMGANAAANMAWLKPKQYRKCLAQSGLFGWNCNSYLNKVLSKMFVKDQKDLPRFYFDSGTFEPFEPISTYQNIYNKIKSWGAEIELKIAYGGIHDVSDWIPRFMDGLQFLYPPNDYKSQLIN